LADIFASFSIHFDKPFKVGDFIIIGNDMGTVKKIGIKSTRITTLEGDELVVSNRDLTETRVHNYKRMRKRRVSFELGVEYSTPVKKLKKIPKIVEGIIKGIDLLEFDRAHFKNFGDFSLNFEVVYYLKSKDYNVYMDKQQEINLKIKEKFDKERIKIAFPTQQIFLKR
jgi:small-conductance mechanosensitive channel